MGRASSAELSAENIFVRPFKRTRYDFEAIEQMDLASPYAFNPMVEDTAPLKERKRPMTPDELVRWMAGDPNHHLLAICLKTNPQIPLGFFYAYTNEKGTNKREPFVCRLAGLDRRTTNLWEINADAPDREDEFQEIVGNNYRLLVSTGSKLAIAKLFPSLAPKNYLFEPKKQEALVFYVPGARVDLLEDGSWLREDLGFQLVGMVNYDNPQTKFGPKNRALVLR